MFQPERMIYTRLAVLESDYLKLMREIADISCFQIIDFQEIKSPTQDLQRFENIGVINELHALKKQLLTLADNIFVNINLEKINLDIHELNPFNLTAKIREIFLVLEKMLMIL